MDPRNKILILFAHPAIHKSRINARMISEVENLDGITINRLYEEYPDFHIHVKREQELLVQHDIIVWQHPFYWYSSPAILKEWIDLVFEHGWAYGKTGKALTGKKLLSAITTGGGKNAYGEGAFNKYTIQQFLAPFRQTALLCKMEYFPPYVVHGTHLFEASDIERSASEYKKILISLRDGLFEDEEIRSKSYLNDLLI